MCADGRREDWSVVVPASAFSAGKDGGWEAQVRLDELDGIPPWLDDDWWISGVVAEADQVTLRSPSQNGPYVGGILPAAVAELQIPKPPSLLLYLLVEGDGLTAAPPVYLLLSRDQPEVSPCR